MVLCSFWIESIIWRCFSTSKCEWNDIYQKNVDTKQVKWRRHREMSIVRQRLKILRIQCDEILIRLPFDCSSSLMLFSSSCWMFNSWSNSSTENSICPGLIRSSFDMSSIWIEERKHGFKNYSLCLILMASQTNCFAPKWEINYLPVAKLSSKISICSELASEKCVGDSVGVGSPSQIMSWGNSRLSIVVVVVVIIIFVFDVNE